MRPTSPRLSALADLRAFLAGRTRSQLWAAGLSVLMTLVIMTMFLIENRWGYSKPAPIIVYAEDWRAGRTAAEAVAAQRATLLDDRVKIMDALAKVDRHTSDRDRARLKAMLEANRAAIARFDAAHR